MSTVCGEEGPRVWRGVSSSSSWQAILAEEELIRLLWKEMHLCSLAQEPLSPLCSAGGKDTDLLGACHRPQGTITLGGW